MLNFIPKGWRHVQGIYTNNVHKSNRQKHSKNRQIKWKQITLPVTRIADAMHILKVIIGDQNTRHWSSLWTIQYNLRSMVILRFFMKIANESLLYQARIPQFWKRGARLLFANFYPIYTRILLNCPSEWCSNNQTYEVKQGKQGRVEILLAK
jgi:hypothetical protein